MKSILLKIALLLTVVGIVACSKSDIDEVLPQQPITDDIAQQGEVRIVIPGGTRSVLEDNGNGGADLRWTSGDEIKLVARDASGADAFTPCVFYFWANKNVAGESYFRTPSLYGDDRETTMPDGTYTYYAVSPSTAIIDGTTAKFTLPATQNGEFSADVDFMVAKAEGSKLVACQGIDENGNLKEETDPKNNLPLVFKHKTHILRFTIPSGNNGFGQKVKKLHMIFPTSVAGTMAVDMDNGTIASTENTTNKITVDFAEPKDAGDEFYVMILPQANVFSKSVNMRFEGVDGTTFSMRHQVNFPQPCLENRLTPVRISIPAVFDSEHAIVSGSFKLGSNAISNNTLAVSVKAPYLFFEDFSGIGTFSDGHDNPAHGGNSDDYLNATMLDNIESSLTGWSASRIGGNKDSKSIRIMCRYEGGLTANA
ncbi:MAG: fimbrillin family protein, partial [Alistipes sp.]|nr:fimbrillin family protein [Alistipes sp.]